MSEADGALDFPATGRNRQAITEVLERVLPKRGLVVEIAAGSGQHAAFIAQALPTLTWQPSDPDPRHRASIAAWTSELDNVRSPLDLDASAPESWAVQPQTVAAVFCANMIHIAPWSACLGLLQGAGRVLDSGGLLALYGPFMIGGEHTAPSNAAFDASLRSRDPSWGVRDLDVVTRVAASHGLEHVETVQMPANNLTVLWRRP